MFRSNIICEGQAGAGVYNLNIKNNTCNSKRYSIHLKGNVNAVKISGNKDLVINKKNISDYKEYYFDKVNEKEITIK